MKKDGQLAGMPKLLWLVLFLWWHYAAVRWATGMVWRLNSEAEAQGQPHVRGMPGAEPLRQQWERNWANLGQKRERASENEEKTSPDK